MAEGFRGMIIAFLLVGLYVFSMITFGNQLVVNNAGNESIADHPSIKVLNTTLSQDLSDAQGDANTRRESFEVEEPSAGFGDILLFSIIGVARGFTTTFITIFNVLFGFAQDTLGIDPIVMGTITAIMLISIIFLSWRVFRVGE